MREVSGPVPWNITFEFPGLWSSHVRIQIRDVFLAADDAEVERKVALGEERIYPGWRVFKVERG